MSSALDPVLIVPHIKSAQLHYHSVFVYSTSSPPPDVIKYLIIDRIRGFIHTFLRNFEIFVHKK